MAVTADQVVVELRAETEAYNRRITQAATNFSNNLKSMSADAVEAGNASAVAFNAASGAFEKVAPAIKKTGDQSKMAQQQMRNLAFQMQDVGTMLAAGQSPFMLLAQQLPQITMYGGQMTGVMGALKQTVSGLISPLGLATTAFVLLGSAAVSYFDELFQSGSKSEEQLKKEAQLIQEVVDKWGDALPALKAYNDERVKTENKKKVEDATADAVEAQWEKLREQIGGFTVDYADLMDQLRTTKAPVDEVERFRVAFFDLKGNIEEGKATQQDYKDVTDALTALLNSSGIPAISSFASAFSSLLGPINAAADATARFNAESNKLTGQSSFAQYERESMEKYAELQKTNEKFTSEAAKRNSMSKEQLDIENEIARVKADADKAGAVFTAQELRNQAQLNIQADKRRSAEESARRKAERDANRKPKRERESDLERASRTFSDRTATIVAETEAQRQLNPAIEDYGFALAKARAEQALINAAQKEGKSITPEMRDNISQIADQYARATAEANQLAEAQGRIKQRADEWQSTAQDATRGLVDDLIAGRSAAEAFADAIQKIIDKLLDMAFDDLFSGLFGGGGFLGGILGRKDGGVVHAATGGYISGRGGPRSDGIPAMLSNGEYVVNAAATKRFGPLLEAINRGQGLALADGGLGSLHAPTTPVSQLSRSSSEGTPYVAGVRVFMDDQMNIRAEMVGIARQQSANTVKAYDKSGPMRFARDSKQANRRGLVR